MNESFIKEENLIIDLNFFPLINALVSRSNRRITKRDLLDLRDEITQWRDYFKESHKSFLKAKHQMEMQIRKQIANKNSPKRREDRRTGGRSSNKNCNQSIWTYIDKLYLPLPSEDDINKMFTVTLPDIEIKEHTHWTNYFTEIARKSSYKAMTPKVEVKSNCQDYDEETLNKLLCSLVPVSNLNTQNSVKKDEDKSAMNQKRYPTIYMSQDPYLSLGFNTRLVMELENLGFSHFENPKDFQVQKEINKLDEQIHNELEPNLKKLRTELTNDLPKYLEKDLKHKKNLAFYQEKLNKH